jgi:hypothetical protein
MRYALGYNDVGNVIFAFFEDGDSTEPVFQFETSIEGLDEYITKLNTVSKLAKEAEKKTKKSSDYKSIVNKGPLH